MPRIKKYTSLRNLDSYQVLIQDTEPTSTYFQLREFSKEFSGGKNGFLITGTPHLQLDTQVLIEILDASGNPIYVEPGKGIPEYYEGTSKVVACYVYDDTPIGIGRITILGELRTYINDRGQTVPIPVEWQSAYNVKWNQDIYINNVQSNETKIRFVKRPILEVTEILKPIYERSSSLNTLSGSISGVPVIPVSGSNYTTTIGDVLYRLETTSSFFTASMAGKDITISGLPGFNTSGTYVTEIRKVQSDQRAIARIPYYVTASTGTVKTISGFSNQVGTITVESTPDYTNTQITGSFAKFRLRRMETFAGDVQRIKLYYKSLNQPGDFQLISDQRLEASEVLRNESSRDLDERTGYFFDQAHINTHWTTASLAGAPGAITALFDTSVLIDAVKLVGSSTANTTDTARYTFENTNQFEVGENVEYTVQFDMIGIRSDTNTPAKIELYASGSPFTTPSTNEHGTLIQTFVLSGSTNSTYATFENVSENFTAQSDGSGSLKFVVYYADWYISDLSLKASQETSFSPDEAIFYLPINADLSGETFIFRAEFFDINNNNVPVRVESDQVVFNAGTTAGATATLFTLNSDSFIFQFNSSSLATPPDQSIAMQITQQNISGDVTWASQSYDINGGAVVPASPLTTQNNTGSTLTVADFSGSANNVQRTVYSAAAGGFSDYVTIYRLQDSNPATSYFLRSDKASFIFDGDTGLPFPVAQTASISAFYQNITGTTTWTVVDDLGTSVNPSHYTDYGNSFELYASAFDLTSGSVFVSGTLAGLSDSLQIYKTVNGVIGANAPYGSFTIDGVLTFKSSSATGWENVGPSYITGSFYVGSGLIAEEIWKIDLNQSTKVLSASIVGADDATVFESISGSGTPVLTMRLLSGSIQLNQTFDVVLDSGQGPAGQDGAFYTIEPQNISFNADANGYVAPASFSAIISTASIYAGNTQYAWSSSLGSQTFTIGTLLTDQVTVSQSVVTSPYIAITSMSTNYGSVTVPITYQDEYGNVSATAYPVIRYSKISDGGDAPSLVYIGDYYYVSSSNPTRPLNNNNLLKDIVSSGSGNVSYYIFTGSDATQIGTTVDPNTGLPDWASLASYSAVATDLLLAQDVVVQKTIMMGLASSGSSDNITLKADTTNPYLSIGQATKGYGQTGIFLGRDSAVSKLSLRGGSNALTWDGTNLVVTGSIIATDGQAGGFDITSDRFVIGTSPDVVGLYPSTYPFFAGATDTDGTGAKFYVTPDGSLTATNATLSGTITATAGSIGGFTVNTTNLSASNFVLDTDEKRLSLGSGASIFNADADEGIWLGASTFATAPFSVDMAGNISASSGVFGGTVTSTTFTPSSGTGSFSGVITADAVLFLDTGLFGDDFSLSNVGGVLTLQGLPDPVPGVASFVMDATSLTVQDSGYAVTLGSGEVSASVYYGDGSQLTGISGGSGTVTSVGSGNGMNFSAITTTGDVTMGTPGTLTAATSNGVTSTSHTHAVTTTGGGTANAIIATDANAGINPTRLGVNVSVPSTDGKIEAGNDVVGFSTSDIRWKSNVTNIKNPLEMMSKIRGVTFDWIENVEHHGYTGKDYGVIAQEVEEIMPEVVKTRDSGFKGVRYERLIPLLVESINTLTAHVLDLQAKLEKLNVEIDK